MKRFELDAGIAIHTYDAEDCVVCHLELVSLDSMKEYQKQQDVDSNSTMVVARALSRKDCYELAEWLLRIANQEAKDGD